MIILNVWEWVISLFVLGVTLCMWAIAVLIIAGLVSLIRDYIRHGKEQ
tara:strand:- start:13350 stop:13493 length:144 start_codon:yes stop_codon:yes gene_type:complete